MRWVIHSRTTFNASHALVSYRGEPEASHDHRWEVATRVGTDALNDEGYALDFHEIHAALDRVVAPLRDSDLNQHSTIGDPTPSAERVAEFLADELLSIAEALGGRLLTISVWEGPENRVDLNLE